MPKLPEVPVPGKTLQTMIDGLHQLLADELRRRPGWAQPAGQQSEEQKDQLEDFMLRQVAGITQLSDLKLAAVAWENPFLADWPVDLEAMPRSSLDRGHLKLRVYLFSELSDWLDEQYPDPMQEPDPDHPSQKALLRLLEGG